MARFSIYVSDEELTWLKEKGPGWLRDLVKREMNPHIPGFITGQVMKATEGQADAQKVNKGVTSALQTINGLRPCPGCGTLITEKQTSHGKCGWKQS